MVIIGLVLLVAAVVVGVDVLWRNNDTVPEPTAFGEALDITTASGLVGIAIGVVGAIGLALLLSGLRRNGMKARHRRRELAETTVEKDRLERENAALRSERSDAEPRQHSG